MQYNNKSIVLSELIGLKARIIKHKDAKQKGVDGKEICFRPEERTEKAIKFYKRRSL